MCGFIVLERMLEYRKCWLEPPIFKRLFSIYRKKQENPEQNRRPQSLLRGLNFGKIWFFYPIKRTHSEQKGGIPTKTRA